MVALAGRSGHGAAGGLGVAKGTVYVAALVAALVPPAGVARNTKTVNDAFGLGERNRSLAQERPDFRALSGAERDGVVA